MKATRISVCLAMAGTALLGSVVAPSNAAELRPIITYEAAQEMINGCVTLAKNENWRMHIAIMNTSGKLIAYVRMTDAIFLSRDISIAKARTSASFPQPSRALGKFAFGDNGPTPFAFIPNEVVFFAGGLPIMSGGTHIGGIGVSGGSADQDEQCAQAGLDEANAADLL